MPCYSPLNGYYKRENGQRKFTLIRKETKDAYPELSQIACNQCIGCKTQRAKDWAIRCAHEMHQYEENAFLTLTYEIMPENEGLIKKDLQDFFKRYRDYLSRHLNKKIRYYACGEYGEKRGRPHFHAIIFNHHFEDREQLFLSKGQQAYSSKILTKLWGHGQAITMDATIGTAIYVSKYITKKITGDMAREAYFSHIDPETGEIHEKIPEFTTMSLKPGLGLPWLKKYYRTELNKGFITHEGTKFRIPRYYKEQLEKLDPCLHEELIAKISKHAESIDSDDTYERLLAREKHAQLTIKQELRNLSND